MIGCNWCNWFMKNACSMCNLKDGLSSRNHRFFIPYHYASEAGAWDPQRSDSNIEDDNKNLTNYSKVVLEFIAGFEPNFANFLVIYLQSGTLTLKRPTEAFMLHQRLKAMASIDGSLSDSVELWFSRRSAHLSSKERNQVSPLMNLQLHQLLPKTVWSFSPEKKWQRYHWWDAIVILWLGWTLGGFLCAHTSPCGSAYICACFCDTIRWYASAKHTYPIFFCGWRGVQLTKHLQKIPQMSTNSCVFLGTDIDIICKKISPTFPGPVWEPWAKTKCLGAPHGVNNSSFRLATARWKTMRDF